MKYFDHSVLIEEDDEVRRFVEGYEGTALFTSKIIYKCARVHIHTTHTIHLPPPPLFFFFFFFHPTHTLPHFHIHSSLTFISVDPFIEEGSEDNTVTDIHEEMVFAPQLSARSCKGGKV